jgi:hypothetical protein
MTSSPSCLVPQLGWLESKETHRASLSTWSSQVAGLGILTACNLRVMELLACWLSVSHTFPQCRSSQKSKPKELVLKASWAPNSPSSISPYSCQSKQSWGYSLYLSVDK